MVYIPRLPTASAGVVAFSKKGEVLLVMHTAYARLPTGSYGFPAGRVNAGESEMEAAMRELWEETGLRTSLDSLIELPQYRQHRTLTLKGHQEAFSFQPFLCTAYLGNLQPRGGTIGEFVPLEGVHALSLVSPDVLKISLGSLYYGYGAGIFSKDMIIPHIASLPSARTF